ncbi:MAG TPA: chemotaxis protein CheW [Bryobacteraceae bacterium]|nr:chemotaxis protein CheW [Bryobacteraceae bacterium]
MASNETNETTQYLTFKMEEEVFAVDVAKVREILDFIPATKVPGTPEFMRGVVNVRGNVVPVVDMRLKFGLTATEKTVDTCIVVMEITVDEETTVLGALVDSVEEVFEMESTSVEPPPKIGTRWRTEFIKGIGKRNNVLIIILDIDRVFSGQELETLQEAGGARVG